MGHIPLSILLDDFIYNQSFINLLPFMYTYYIYTSVVCKFYLRWKYRPSLLRSLLGLDTSDLISKVVLLAGLIFYILLYMKQAKFDHIITYLYSQQPVKLWLYSYFFCTHNSCHRRMFCIHTCHCLSTGVPHWLWAGKEVPRQPDASTHPLQGGQELDGDSPLRQHQRPPRHWAESTRRHGVTRLCPHVLQPRQSALAGPQGNYLLLIWKHWYQE